MKKSPIKTIVAIGIGAAIFFVLGRFVAIPSPIPNTTINIQYSVLALFAVMYGPIAGFLIGLVGHILIDLSWGAPWWSWIIASAVVGLIIGLASKKINLESGSFGKKEIIGFNIVQVVANAVAWLLVAPGLDVLIYSEPASKVFTQGVFAFIVNAVSVAIVGTLLMIAYAKTRTKKGSLSKD